MRAKDVGRHMEVDDDILSRSLAYGGYDNVGFDVPASQVRQWGSRLRRKAYLFVVLIDPSKSLTPISEIVLCWCGSSIRASHMAIGQLVTLLKG